MIAVSVWRVTLVTRTVTQHAPLLPSRCTSALSAHTPQRVGRAVRVALGASIVTETVFRIASVSAHALLCSYLACRALPSDTP